ncbi:putative oxalocrotonate tautomerase [Paraphoma chrysanthemicola]|uniref:Oxalocrotonate tautomerase n=1 Tax=Paraphoma chrysanthemicola TaxID=798071 RepID=A0A8K0RGA9_9PLEO|nr:putative oxalocrotonate tautomerase [Paraphoma chrysanthemicola]
MPLWIIYHPPSTFTTPESKQTFAQAITNIYTQVPLPAFYVNVLFQPIAADSFYIGGVPRPSEHVAANDPGPQSERPFIRIVIQNIARTLRDEKRRDGFLSRVDKALKPHIEDQGYDVEYSVYETRRDLWKIDGMVPPMPGSEAEKEWARLNRAVGFERAKGGLGEGVRWEGEERKAKL